ncbi:MULTISPECIES: pentapeptide repeat-containing protein [unclassified Amycolatopsis]|uniref:pentapeptide repeat-containing protein n=1 Tax=unclassified Amycolatopsis TaxID=2618356 RepID=UPI00287640FF|nr:MULTISPECIES: pentapeptide repeat-containing protein [unclassified Amycolatopsis]MDS0139607.1 pentapeptide repeat-containing protein [Amycolatopsis sp. 505]MDS0147186.1 pentapeptide repeat-containing protein [Amycolatopsis sp. CM201R]
MSTVTPFAVLAVIGAASGSVTAWLLLRRDRPAEVLTPSAPAEPVPDEVAARLLADEHTVRLAELASFAEQADADPERRQECVHAIAARFDDDWPDPVAWQAELWQLLRPHLRRESPRFWPGMDLDLDYLVLHAVDLRGCEVRRASFVETSFAGPVDFTGATAAEYDFTGAHVRIDADVVRVWPPGWEPGEPEPQPWVELRER